MDRPVWVKPAVVGAGFGANAMAVIGFSRPGWQTSRAAHDFAEARVDAAVVSALVPFCVAKAEKSPDQAMLARVRAEDSSYSRSTLVALAGWAVVGDATRQGNARAEKCGDRPHDMVANL